MLRIENISKTYQNKPLLDNITLAVHRGEILCLLGPSGSGKSTLLRIVAGLEEPERGVILWNNEDISHLSAHKRNFGLMFQDYALFPHMTVGKNVAFGLEMKGMPTHQIDSRVLEVLEMVDMASFLQRKVTDLSGGEKQRVALARALAPQPQLLMLDEPLGSLDRTLRDQLLTDLGSMLQRLETPVIYVTHDQEEAFSIGDRLAVLHDTSIIQVDTPETIYSCPASLWLAGFLGFRNQLGGSVASIHPLTVNSQIGRFQIEPCGSAFQRGNEVVLVFKPDGLDRAHCDGTNNCLEGVVWHSLFFGDRYKMVLETGNGLSFTFFWEERMRPGEKVRFAVRPDSILCYKRKQHG